VIDWSDPVVELLGFLASFLAVGAVGFRLIVLPGAARAAGPDDAERFVVQQAARRAALFGFLGALAVAVLFALKLPAMAERQHLAVGALLSSHLQTQVQAGLVLAALAGFALVLARASFGYALAALGVLGAPLSGIFFGSWTRIVNPVHKLAAGMWIGTLFILLVAGIVPILRSALPTERRAALLGGLVRAFSPLALVSTGVLAVFGVITAWRHLHTIEALWTTPYGITLIIKLLAVGAVLVLGAWNWRRQKPRLGTEAGAHGLRRSATGELLAALVVLVITSVLVSLPSPRPPRVEAPAPAAGTPPPTP
jgi:copper transport protein